MGVLTFYDKHPAYDHVYFHDGVVMPSVTKIIGDMGLATHFASQWHLDFGTAVHRVVELYERGTLDWGSIDPRVRPRLDAYIKFKEQHGFKPRLIEHKAHSHAYNFCCRLDFEGECDGKDGTIVELKSGAYQEWWGYQLAGQDVCLGPSNNGIRRRFALELKEDGDLLNYVNDHRIPLEICLTSNVQTKAAPSYELHPFKFYYEFGLRVTINTDNRLISGTTATDEYYLAAKYAQMDMDDVKEIIIAGFKSAFLSVRTTKKILYIIWNNWNKKQCKPCCNSCKNPAFFIITMSTNLFKEYSNLFRNLMVPTKNNHFF